MAFSVNIEKEKHGFFRHNFFVEGTFHIFLVRINRKPIRRLRIDHCQHTMSPDELEPSDKVAPSDKIDAETSDDPLSFAEIDAETSGPRSSGGDVLTNPTLLWRDTSTNLSKAQDQTFVQDQEISLMYETLQAKDKIIKANEEKINDMKELGDAKDEIANLLKENGKLLKQIGWLLKENVALEGTIQASWYAVVLISAGILAVLVFLAIRL